MTTKKQKMRGSRTHGYGSKKKHRGGGSRGGRGFSGMHKHKFSLVVTKDKNHYGFKGFVNPNRNPNRIINIEDMEKLEKNGHIDLTKMGYDKLLSRGRAGKAVTVKVKKASQRAIEKIEKAGGKVLLEKQSG